MMQGNRPLDTLVIARMNRGDSVRTTWLASQVDSLGWPGVRAYGKDAADCRVPDRATRRARQRVPGADAAAAGAGSGGW